MSLTIDEYYDVFSAGCIIACYAVGLIVNAKNSRALAPQSIVQHHEGNDRHRRLHFSMIAGGYILAMLVILLSKNLWRIPEWAFEATSRYASEQFAYGFWPLNIFTSPIINGALIESFRTHSLPVNETPFGSSSGIAVPISLLILVLTWIYAKRDQYGVTRRRDDALILAFGAVLVTLLIAACLVASMGGLGTLFAVYVSPQLRALNRFTPYFYCPAVVICAIKLDQLLTLYVAKKPRLS
jgi:hypothetical protein